MYIYIYMEFTWWNIQNFAPDLDFQDQFHEILWIFSENRLQRQDSIHQQCWMIRIPITPVDDECSITTGFLCVCALVSVTYQHGIEECEFPSGDIILKLPS